VIFADTAWRAAYGAKPGSLRRPTPGGIQAAPHRIRRDVLPGPCSTGGRRSGPPSSALLCFLHAPLCYTKAREIGSRVGNTLLGNLPAQRGLLAEALSPLAVNAFEEAARLVEQHTQACVPGIRSGRCTNGCTASLYPAKIRGNYSLWMLSCMYSVSYSSRRCHRCA
jgi:hypothetical protein